MISLCVQTWIAGTQLARGRKYLLDQVRDTIQCKHHAGGTE